MKFLKSGLAYTRLYGKNSNQNMANMFKEDSVTFYAYLWAYPHKYIHMGRSFGPG